MATSAVDNVAVAIAIILLVVGLVGTLTTAYNNVWGSKPNYTKLMESKGPIKAEDNQVDIAKRVVEDEATAEPEEEGVQEVSLPEESTEQSPVSSTQLDPIKFLVTVEGDVEDYGSYIVLRDGFIYGNVVPPNTKLEAEVVFHGRNHYETGYCVEVGFMKLYPTRIAVRWDSRAASYMLTVKGDKRLDVDFIDFGDEKVKVIVSFGTEGVVVRVYDEDGRLIDGTEVNRETMKYYLGTEFSLDGWRPFFHVCDPPSSLEIYSAVIGPSEG